MEKDILIIAHFVTDFDETGNGRFNYLANLLAQEASSVELITSDFSHNKKVKRDKLLKKFDYKVTFIAETGYSRNISIRRFYSHFIMARNLKKYLLNRKKPDVIYCSVPSLDVAKIAAEYAEAYNVKFIIDVQDLWPEAFEMVFKLPIISGLLYRPMQKQADYIYAMADEIIAVSDTYNKRALQVNKKCEDGYSVFLGTELDSFDRMSELNKFIGKPENEFWLVYAGTLGHSYDLTSVIDALSIIKNKGILNIKFIVLGDGPLKEKFEGYVASKSIIANFTGRLPYSKMVGMLKVCDIAVNPIEKGAAASIINKHADYAAAGLPVINTQESSEYRNLVEHYEMGLNCENNNAQDLANKILILYYNSALRQSMGRNSRKLASEKFDRKKTYKNITEIILR